MGFIPHVTNNQAELSALMQGLKKYSPTKPLPLEIATDLTEVINMLCKGSLSMKPLFINAGN